MVYSTVFSLSDYRRGVAERNINFSQRRSAGKSVFCSVVWLHVNRFCSVITTVSESFNGTFIMRSATDATGMKHEQISLNK